MSEPTPMKRACEIVHPGIGVAPRLDGGPCAPLCERVEQALAASDGRVQDALSYAAEVAQGVTHHSICRNSPRSSSDEILCVRCRLEEIHVQESQTHEAWAVEALEWEAKIKALEDAYRDLAREPAHVHEAEHSSYCNTPDGIRPCDCMEDARCPSCVAREERIKVLESDMPEVDPAWSEDLPGDNMRKCLTCGCGMQSGIKSHSWKECAEMASLSYDEERADLTEAQDRIKVLEAERDEARRLLDPAVIAAARGLVLYAEGHPAMCCSKCAKAIAEAEAERDRLAASVADLTGVQLRQAQIILNLTTERAKAGLRRGNEGGSMKVCTEKCWTMPDCTVCGLTKHPVGRDPGMYAGSSYCQYECPGHNAEPSPGHHWPGEECDKYCPEEQILEDHAKGVKP